LHFADIRVRIEDNVKPRAAIRGHKKCRAGNLREAILGEDDVEEPGNLIQSPEFSNKWLYNSGELCGRVPDQFSGRLKLKLLINDRGPNRDVRGRKFDSNVACALQIKAASGT
jgi:hypothetical protein